MSVGPFSYQIKLGGVTPVAVPKNGTIYTDVFDLSGVDEFVLSYKAAGTGSASVKVELEQSLVGPAVPNTADANFVIPDNAQDVNSNLSDKDQHHIRLFPVCVRFMRFKITELTDVMTDLALTLNLSLQKKIPND